ncbi:MAG: hypothetical protein AB9866_11050 [Syntrophobacteraceae bacterium]
MIIPFPGTSIESAPVGAFIFVIGSEETRDVMDAVQGQLEIWRKDKRPARYIDQKDRIVSIAAVRGLRPSYCAFVMDFETGALDMLKAREVPPTDNFAEAQRLLDAYAEKKGWIDIPSPESVQTALALVMVSPPPPDTEVIAAWSDLEKIRAAMWATATHLKASDNPIRVPPVPNCLFDYV